MLDQTKKNGTHRKQVLGNIACERRELVDLGKQPHNLHASEWRSLFFSQYLRGNLRVKDLFCLAFVNSVIRGWRPMHQSLDQRHFNEKCNKKTKNPKRASGSLRLICCILEVEVDSKIFSRLGAKLACVFARMKNLVQKVVFHPPPCDHYEHWKPSDLIWIDM